MRLQVPDCLLPTGKSFDCFEMNTLNDSMLRSRTILNLIISDLLDLKEGEKLPSSPTNSPDQTICRKIQTAIGTWAQLHGRTIWHRGEIRDSIKKKVIMPDQFILFEFIYQYVFPIGDLGCYIPELAKNLCFFVLEMCHDPRFRCKNRDAQEKRYSERYFPVVIDFCKKPPFANFTT